MILQSLVHLYDELRAQGKVVEEGWGLAKVSHRLVLDYSGKLVGIISARKKIFLGKKEKEVPMDSAVPLPVTRSSGVKANFLCDNFSYMLGIVNIKKSENNEGKSEEDRRKEAARKRKLQKRAKMCFEAAKILHHKVLDSCNSEEAQSILTFFDTWDVDNAKENPIIQDNWEDILAGANLLIQVGNIDAVEVLEIRQAWEAYYNQAGGAKSKTSFGQCLITGKKNQPIAILHPKIKGIPGAQTSGANLVSFNADADCSYGRDGEQGTNAPVSEEAAIAYGTALNYLLADRKHIKVMGDTTVVYWADNGEDSYQDCFAAMMGDSGGIGNKELDDILAHMNEGIAARLEGVEIRPDEPFYILGLSPNAARISVRFFLRNTFGSVLENIEIHERRMKIIYPSWEKDRIPLWRILKATVNPHAKDSASSPLLAGSLLKTVFTGGRYPEAVYQNIMRRVFLDHDELAGGGKPAVYKVSYVKAAFIKAYLLKNCSHDWEGEIQMAVNENCNDMSYVLGRLFSVLENIQQSANPGINSTIKDKYFNSACATPASVFPVLLKLANAHLGKLEQPRAVYFRKQLGMLLDKIVIPDTGTPLPHRLTLDEQGAFVLGYYQETQARYVGKKEEK